MAGTPKKVAAMFDEALETYEKENNILPLCEFIEPDGAELQISGDVVVRPVEQHRPVISGWDMSAQNNDIIEEAYFAYLGTPSNDSIQQRADALRDPQYLMRAAKTSGKKQAAALNAAILAAVAAQGSLFYRSSVTSGFDFASEAKAIMDERGLAWDDRFFVFNNRDTQLYAKDLAARQTLQGRPETVWTNGQLGRNIAGFDIYESPHCPVMTGGANPGTTVTGNQSFAPLPGTVVTAAPTSIVTNNDYRYASIVVAASGGYSVGDKVEIKNAGTAVQSVNLLDKSATGTGMTFTVVAKPDATHLLVSPKPIALDDAALDAVEAAYSNINTQILNAATVDRLNIDATNKTNLFWQRKAVEVIGGTLPANLMAQYAGWQKAEMTMKNGLKMYMFYDGNIDTLQFRFRLFTWYGITIAIPHAAGVAVTV